MTKKNEKITVELSRYELQIITRWVIDKAHDYKIDQTHEKNKWKTIVISLSERLYALADKLDIWPEDPNNE